MRIRLICLALGLLSIPALASADDHRWDGYIGGSGGNGASKLGGIHTALGITAAKYGVLRKVSFVIDWSTQLGKHGDVGVTQFAYAFGGRVMASKGAWKAKPFAHVLGGGVYQADGGVDPNAKSLTVGFGMDFVPHPLDAGRGYGYRFQVDRIQRSGEREDFWRVSGGVIYRFGQHK